MVVIIVIKNCLETNEKKLLNLEWRNQRKKKKKYEQSEKKIYEFHSLPLL